MSSPERGTRGAYEEPYYSQYGTRGGSVTPIIDEEQRYKLNADIRSMPNHYLILFPSHTEKLNKQRYFHERRSICIIWP